MVPKRKQSVRRKKQMTSSTTENFLDDSSVRKCNSTECILDRDDGTDNALYNHLDRKKCVSENDLLRDSLDSSYLDIYNSNYLLSLKDLERIGNLQELSSTEKKETKKEVSKSNHEVRTTNKNSLHKPKIVGVIVSYYLIEVIAYF